MWAYCKSCLTWLDLPDEIPIQALKGGKGLVVHEGRVHCIITGRRLENLKLKNPPPVTPVEKPEVPDVLEK